MPWREALCANLPRDVAKLLMNLTRTDAAQLTEIRARVGQPVCFAFVFGMREMGGIITHEMMEELVNSLCSHSRYAYEAQMAQGFIPLPGGHRAGICGRAVYENGEIVRLSAIRSVCIRIARHIDGASASFRKHLFIGGRPTRTLLLGPPGCGKTTALRDAAMYLARQFHLQVAVADEREELFCGRESEAVDVISGASKADALRMLIRSMAPQVVVTDEIGRLEDARALLDAASGGVGVLASAHAEGFEDVLRKPALRLLYEQRAFDWYILLGKMGVCKFVWDANGIEIVGGAHGQLGCGDDGDDFAQCDRVSGGGW